MTITTAMIKELRERTGTGMMDCKKALTEADGNLDLAIENLRKKGAATAQKKAGRIAAEGVIIAAQNQSTCVLAEINSETDFVAKDASFVQFAQSVAQAALDNASASTDPDALATMTLENGHSVETARQELITKIGENISVRRIARLETSPSEGEHDGIIGCYLHGSRIGVLAKLKGTAPDKLKELGRDIAMHIAASKPLCISEQDVEPDILTKEKEIFIAQAQESGKPADIIEKIVAGQIKKFLKENTLLGQPFVKNPDQTVGDLLKQSGATITEMVRFEVGEGLEKRSDDFVTEVMAQAGMT